MFSLGSLKLLEKNAPPISNHAFSLRPINMVITLGSYFEIFCDFKLEFV